MIEDSGHTQRSGLAEAHDCAEEGRGGGWGGGRVGMAGEVSSGEGALNFM